MTPRQPIPAPLADLIDILAAHLVEDYLLEQAASNTEESNTSAPPLARTGTDGE
jgi:hypothetical protein